MKAASFARGLLWVALLLVLVQGIQCLAVMSVDLGSEWMKVAVVSPGVPMEVALNAESKRKTAAAVAFRHGDRTFGSEALQVAVKEPRLCYFYMLDLLGKKLDHPSVKHFQERFPYYVIEPDPERGTVLFRHDENTVFSVEELVGMLLAHAKTIAEEYTGQKIKDAVLTVPVYFNQAERRALLAAANLANLNVLQLISEQMAVGLNYGMFRRKEVNEATKYMMFYEMGAYDTSVAIVSYQIIKTKERGFSETHPQAQILGMGFDRTLGGMELQIKLRDYLADQFNLLQKTKTDVRSVARSMAKLFVEAGKVKTVLSANAAISAQVENLLENIDFKLEVKREKFLELNAPFFSRVVAPIEQALKASAVTLDEISEVILMGGGTRVPQVQQLISQYLTSKGHKSNGELGKSLNTDEAAVMGAVYKSADLSTGFKVKKFITKDLVLYPIVVDFERLSEHEEKKDVVRRSLFSMMNPFPQKKIMTFYKHTADFNFSVNYDEPDFPQIQAFTDRSLYSVAVSGISQALEKNAGDNVESKGVKAHFSMDESGLLHITSIESVFEKNVTAAEADKEAAATDEAGESKDNAWATLGDKITSFFGDNKQPEAEGSGDKIPDPEKDQNPEDPQQPPNKKKKIEVADKKPKVETVKEALSFEVTVLDLIDLNEDQSKVSRSKLEDLDKHDRLKKARATALNALESFIIDTRDKSYEDLYEKSSTEEELQIIRDKLSQVSDWIDEEATVDTELEVLEGKLKELKELTAPLFSRVKEHLDRPEALDALFKMINASEYFLAKAKNSTSKEDGYFTQTEVEVLEKKVHDVKVWKEQAEKEQSEQPLNEMPRLTTQLIAEKGLELDREVKYLVNKAKIAKAEKERERKKKELEEAEARLKKEEEAKKKKKKQQKSVNSTAQSEAEQVEDEMTDTTESYQEEKESDAQTDDDSNSAERVEEPQDEQTADVDPHSEL